MSADPHALIDALSADLRPVRRLLPPTVRAALWLGLVAAAAGVLAPLVRMDQVHHRMAALPDLWWATAGAVATAVCAAWAAFQASVPGRSALWAALPVPPALVWLGASGWGCLRTGTMPGLEPATMHDAMGCAAFIAFVSAPLSLLLLLMVRRACPLWPGRVAALGGLAAAAAAASLLALFHPHDASAVDLSMHVVAVAAVMGVTRWAG